MHYADDLLVPSHTPSYYERPPEPLRSRSYPSPDTRLSTTMAPTQRPRKNVHFPAKRLVSSISRQPTDDDAISLARFDQHARICTKCRDLIYDHDERTLVCSKGDALARKLTGRIMQADGAICESHHGTACKTIRIELPDTSYPFSRRLLDMLEERYEETPPPPDGTARPLPKHSSSRRRPDSKHRDIGDLCKSPERNNDVRPTRKSSPVDLDGDGGAVDRAVQRTPGLGNRRATEALKGYQMPLDVDDRDCTGHSSIDTHVPASNSARSTSRSRSDEVKTSQLAETRTRREFAGINGRGQACDRTTKASLPRRHDRVAESGLLRKAVSPTATDSLTGAAYFQQSGTSDSRPPLDIASLYARDWQAASEPLRRMSIVY